jgi:hypothetical protein
MLFHLLILALASALAAPASAQMFKCVGADGRVTYNDRPCDTRAKQTDGEGRMTGRAPAIRYYEIYSKDWAGSFRPKAVIRGVD